MQNLTWMAAIASGIFIKIFLECFEVGWVVEVGKEGQRGVGREGGREGGRRGGRETHHSEEVTGLVVPPD